MILQIRQERLKRGWTQEYVAKRVQLTKVAIHNIETGRRNPSFKVLVKLENLFQLNHQYLFKQIDDESNNQG